MPKLSHANVLQKLSCKPSASGGSWSLGTISPRGTRGRQAEWPDGNNKID